MKFAFILDPLADLKVPKDSSVAMMAEAAARGHEIHVLEQGGLAWLRSKVIGHAKPLHLTGEVNDWYRAGAPQQRSLADFDAVLMRKDPPFDLEYVYTTYLLELAEAQGARVFNRARALRDFNEKLAIAKFPQFTAPTLVTREETLIREFLAEHGDIILKPLDGMGGSGIFRLHQRDPNIGVVLETLTHYGRRTVMAQRYIAEISQGDKRILLIAGEPLPYALARIPKAGETRGNLAAGGTGVAQPLSARDREIAETVGPQLWKEGLLLVGLDVIGDYLTEINVTSPTCMQEIRAQTDCDPAAIFIDALEAACAA